MGKFTSAVILAAGIGKRYASDVRKQFDKLCGVPCIIYTLRAFEAAQTIDEIVLVGDRKAFADVIEASGEEFKKLRRTVEGGETRQRSATLGFDAVSRKCKYVALHDGARCLVTPEIIDKTVSAAYKYRAAAAAHACSDTVKTVSKGDFVNRTLDRSEIWTVQTPQVFDADVYRVSAYMAIRDGAEVTDDCMLAERLGFDVKLIECGRENMKLTEPGDKRLFEAILGARAESAEKH